jgi:flagellar FliL protein
MTVTAMPQAPAGEENDETATPRRSRKKLILILVAVLAIGGGGYWFFLKPAPAGPPKAGVVVTLEPIQVNLAATHYLRLGIALQLVEGVAEADGSKALDAAIDEFSGLEMADVNDPVKRAAYKKALEKELDHRYEGEVMGVYFTEFVTQ